MPLLRRTEHQAAQDPRGQRLASLIQFGERFDGSTELWVRLTLIRVVVGGAHRLLCSRPWCWTGQSQRRIHVSTAPPRKNSLLWDAPEVIVMQEGRRLRAVDPSRAIPEAARRIADELAEKHATLERLRDRLERCPSSMWQTPDPPNELRVIVDVNEVRDVSHILVREARRPCSRAWRPRGPTSPLSRLAHRTARPARLFDQPVAAEERQGDARGTRSRDRRSLWRLRRLR